MFLIPVISGVFGLLFGSFANVLIHRVPRGENVSRPRSACPSCRTAIRPRDNVPVASWLFLRGRCRHCQASISVRYPLVELVSAIVCIALGSAAGWNWSLPAFLFFGWVLVVLSAIDIDTHRLPNAVLYPASAISAGLLLFAGLMEGDGRSLVESVAGGAVAFGVMFVVWFVARGGLGYGDVRLSGYLGLHLGYLTLGHVPVGLFMGFLTGAVGGMVAMVVFGRGRKHKVAFGPYLALGGVIAVLWGQQLIDLYLGR